jgi:hypothetical protein
MNVLHPLAALAFGAVLLAGCNPDRDATDTMSDADQTTAPADPAAPTTAPPPPDDTGTMPGTETMPPATDPAPTDQPPPPQTEPDQEPAPPPNN